MPFNISRSNLLFRGTLDAAGLQVVRDVPADRFVLVKSWAVYNPGSSPMQVSIGSRPVSVPTAYWFWSQEVAAGAVVSREFWAVLEPEDQLLLGPSLPGLLVSIFGTMIRS